MGWAAPRGSQAEVNCVTTAQCPQESSPDHGSTTRPREKGQAIPGSGIQSCPFSTPKSSSSLCSHSLLLLSRPLSPPCSTRTTWAPWDRPWTAWQGTLSPASQLLPSSSAAATFITLPWVRRVFPVLGDQQRDRACCGWASWPDSSEAGGDVTPHRPSFGRPSAGRQLPALPPLCNGDRLAGQSLTSEARGRRAGKGWSSQGRNPRGQGWAGGRGWGHLISWILTCQFVFVCECILKPTTKGKKTATRRPKWPLGDSLCQEQCGSRTHLSAHATHTRTHTHARTHALTLSPIPAVCATLMPCTLTLPVPPGRAGSF